MRRLVCKITILCAAVVPGALSYPAWLWPACAVQADEDKSDTRDVADSSVGGTSPTTEQAEYFRDKVLPLLETRCFECHGDQDDVEGELHLTSRQALLKGGENGPCIVPGDPDRSLLVEAIRYESFQMPPRSKMPDAEIEIFVKWIADGAPWPEDMESKTAVSEADKFPLEERIAAHWAWKKIERPAVPSVLQADWPAGDIDRFLLAKMEDTGIRPAPDADRRAILRRLCFDLTGLPPGIQQQDRFLSDPDETPVATGKLVDELLDSPQFGERWARHWLDLVRYAETLGHEFDYPLPYAWRYRDYVIRAINTDVPYDQFVREHIAGDLMTNPRRNPEAGFNESIIATGFWYLCEDKHAPVDVKAEEALRIDNQIDVFGKTFLGLTVSCARCHDHKFDAITSEDYYALSGFLQSSRRRVELLDSHTATGQLVAELQAVRETTSSQLRQGISHLHAKALAAQLIADTADGASPASFPADFRTDPKHRDLSSPLSLLAAVIQTPADADLGLVIQKWAESVSQTAAQRQADRDAIALPAGDTGRQASATYADLRTGLPQDWFAFGAAFEHVPQPAAAAEPAATAEAREASAAAATTWQPSGPRPDSRDAVSSAVLSPKLRGQLHSPEFELRSPEILILAAGTGCRVRLVMDGYVMNEFSELLFGGMRQPIETEGQFRWIRIAGDTHRYAGHRCHLEFLDEGDGWFAVKEIRFPKSGGEQPPQLPEIPQSSVVLAQMLRERPGLSREEIIHHWAQIVIQDPAWPAAAAEFRLLPELQQAAYLADIEKWKQLAEKPQQGEPVLVMCEGTGEDEYVFIRGNHNHHGPAATRHLLTALDGAQPLHDQIGSGRTELADRLLADSNPFPARVAVNRVWQHLFGRGIVSTSDNFGVLGEAPTHPELLDFLADEFRKDGWSMKRLIKRLVMTRAYRQSSQRIPDAEQKDPANLSLHRFSIRRLEAEVIRDAMLAVSGKMNRTMYGPPVPVYLTSFMQGRGRPGQSGPLDGDGRRSIYQAVNRNFLNPFMLAFDTPQPATAVARRNKSNVPAQALIMLNNEFVHQQAGEWARRLVTEAPSETLDRAFREAFSRPPSVEERLQLTEFAEALAEERQSDATRALQDAAILSEICHILLNQKEFLYLD